MNDRLVEIRVKGMRSLEDVQLRLGGLTVLVGENGAGKSSLIEALELLHKAAAPSFVHRLGPHGSLSLLLREGAPALELGLRIEGDEGPIDYSFAVAPEGYQVVIARESMDFWQPGSSKDGPLHVIRRTRTSAKVFDQGARKLAAIAVDGGSLLVSAFGALPPQRAIARTVAILDNIDVHLPFDVRAFWACKERGWSAPLREAVLLEPVGSLSRVGDNLANAYYALKNDHSTEHWRETMEHVRLGLGQEVESVNTRAAAGGGQIALSLELRGLKNQVPAATIADGALAYLAFVALLRLRTGAARSLLAFDEPDLHLHPQLLVRVVGFFETLARRSPVVIATQSDRLLDALTDPASSAILCRLTGAGADPSRRATELFRPNRERLQRWLAEYRGLGDVRAQGAEDVVMTERG